VRIREGRLDDVGAMHALDLACFAEPFRFDLRTMRRFATARGSIVRVAEGDGGELAGFVIVERMSRATAYVVTLDVAEGFRRKGLARRLLAEAIKSAAIGGARWVGLHVHAENDGAIGFYEAAGFEFVERVPAFYACGLDGLVYRLAIETA
jgi:ribosomal-protein-alanine N-acetyltransferase